MKEKEKKEQIKEQIKGAKSIGKTIDRGISMLIYADPGCLAGDTHIGYKIGIEGKRLQNDRGGTLKHLYERFNKIKVKGKGFYQRSQTLDSLFYVPSIREDGSVFLNQVYGVMYSGRKKLWRVETRSGRYVDATEDHKFYVGTKYKSLSELIEGEKVYIHTNHIPKKGRDKRPYRKCLYVKYHPYWSEKLIDHKYTFYSAHLSRAIYEAHINDMDFNSYVELLNSGDKKAIWELKFISPDLLIHHLDEDIENNAIDNLLPVSSKQHNYLHIDSIKKRLSYYVQEDEIRSIKYGGVKDTYDVKVNSPYNNFVANDIVVHNCGKTTLLTTLPVGETLIINVEAGLGPLLGTGHHVINLDQNLKQLQRIYEEIATKEHQYKNICIDNISEMQDWMVITLTQLRGKDFTEIKEYGDASQKTREYLHLFRDLTFKGMNVIFTAWEMPMPIEEGEDITVTRIYPKLFKKLAPEICGIVDLVGHLEMYEKTGDRFIRFVGTNKIIAKSQFKNILKFEPANLPYIFEKICAYDYTDTKPPALTEVSQFNVGK